MLQTSGGDSVISLQSFRSRKIALAIAEGGTEGLAIFLFFEKKKKKPQKHQMPSRRNRIKFVEVLPDSIAQGVKSKNEKKRANEKDKQEKVRPNPTQEKAQKCSADEIDDIFTSKKKETNSQQKSKDDKRTKAWDFVKWVPHTKAE